jgi:hypothetical protein
MAEILIWEEFLPEPPLFDEDEEEEEEEEEEDL